MLVLQNILNKPRMKPDFIILCAGLYSCTVEWSVEEPVEREFQVSVIIPASARPLQARVEVREGHEAEVRPSCCQGHHTIDHVMPGGL